MFSEYWGAGAKPLPAPKFEKWVFMNESPIFIKTQVFAVWLLERTERFRKTQRFVMGKRLQDAILNFQEAIIQVAKKDNSIEYLREADAQLEMVRRHIRTCVDLKLLSPRQYEYAAGHLVELGKLLGGWINKENKGMNR